MNKIEKDIKEIKRDIKMIKKAVVKFPVEDDEEGEPDYIG